MIPRMNPRPSQAPANACTRVSAMWWERAPGEGHFCGRMCTPANPAWLRKQSKRGWSGACHEPRENAKLVWCTLPWDRGDWRFVEWNPNYCSDWYPAWCRGPFNNHPRPVTCVYTPLPPQRP